MRTDTEHADQSEVLQGLDHVRARLLLVVRRDGVLEVEEHGRRPRSGGFSSMRVFRTRHRKLAAVEAVASQPCRRS